MRDSMALCTQFLVYLITHKKMKITFFLKKKSRSKKKASSFSKHCVKTKEDERAERKPDVSHGNRF